MLTFLLFWWFLLIHFHDDDNGDDDEASVDKKDEWKSDKGNVGNKTKTLPQLHHFPSLSLSPIIRMKIADGHGDDEDRDGDVDDDTLVPSFSFRHFPHGYWLLQWVFKNLLMIFFLQFCDVVIFLCRIKVFPCLRLVCHKSLQANGPYHLSNSKAISQSFSNSNLKFCFTMMIMLELEKIICWGW